MARTCSIFTGAHPVTARMTIILVVLFLSLGMINLLAPPPRAGAQPGLELPEVPDGGAWTTNGYVECMATDGNVVYIGGGFSRVGPNTGTGAVFNAGSDTPLSPFLRINRDVNCSAADGSGGWFIGGYFNGVGGLERNFLAHILPDGSVDPAWAPIVDGPVYGICADGGSVYIAGDFENVGGQPRRYLAGLNADTGAVTGFNPAPNSSVSSLAAAGGTVYAGGYFNSIGGQFRDYLAALDGTTGAATAWDPKPNSNVDGLAIDGSTLYAGGYFGFIGGQSRSSLAGLDMTTGLATGFNPAPNSNVYELAVDGGIVYAVGYFNFIGGQSRTYLAGLDGTTGAATAFNPSPSSNVYALAVDGGTVYAGGYFNNIGGQSRNYLAALDGTTGAATAWDPNPDDNVNTISAEGGKVFAGGYFSIMGGVERTCLAALDPATGTATAWDPQAEGEVTSLACANGLVYAGGYFDFIGGQPRGHLAALDPASGAATAWDPSADSGVYSVAVEGNTVYAGGEFNNIGGESRNYLAALDAGTGAATAWNPNPDNYVYDLATAYGLVYAGGDFNRIGGQPRDYIAALDPASGAATGWDPDADDSVVTLTVNNGQIYAGGFFARIGRQARDNLAALDADTGLATGWNPGADTLVTALVPHDDQVYAGGSFSSIGGNARMGLAAVDAAGNSTAWDPNKGSWIFFGPSMLANAPREALEAEAAMPPLEGKNALLNAKVAKELGTGTKTSIGPGRYYLEVSSMILLGNTLYVGGFFGNIGYYSQGGLATFTDVTDNWYMAEGSTEGGMETWILVENPNPTKVKVDLTFDTEKGQVAPAELQNVIVPADSRISFNVGAYLTGYHVSSEVTSHGGEVVCERAMYGNDKAWGSSSPGTKAVNSAWYMAEGSTDGGMKTWALVQNPNDFPVSMNVSFLTGDGEFSPSSLQGYNLLPHRRVSVDVGEYVTSYDVSTKVTSDGGGVVCERSTYGPPVDEEGNVNWATSSMGSKGPSRTWFLTEGATDQGRETWVLVENPFTQPADVDVMFLSGAGEVQGPQETIPGMSRRSYNAGDYVQSYDVSTVIISSGGGVVCERAMYGNDRAWGATSPGSTETAASWNLAEGSTDGGMETWILVLNPYNDATKVSLSFMTAEGLKQPAELQNLTLPALSRFSIRVNDFVTSYNVSTQVDATSGVLCERSTYGMSGEGDAATVIWATSSEGIY
jgi:hypothetical protein